MAVVPVLTVVEDAWELELDETDATIANSGLCARMLVRCVASWTMSSCRSVPMGNPVLGALTERVPSVASTRDARTCWYDWSWFLSTSVKLAASVETARVTRISSNGTCKVRVGAYRSI